MKGDCIFYIYGEGGHKAQMDRFKSLITTEQTEVINIVDTKNMVLGSNYYYVPPLRKKFNNKKIYVLYSSFYNFCYAFYLIYKFKPKALISTGPALCIPFFLISKLIGSKTIFIETWSRFYSKSFTAKLAYPLVDRFYYQNIELATLYPKGHYAGRL